MGDSKTVQTSSTATTSANNGNDENLQYSGSQDSPYSKGTNQLLALFPLEVILY